MTKRKKRMTPTRKQLTQISKNSGKRKRPKSQNIKRRQKMKKLKRLQLKEKLRKRDSSARMQSGGARWKSKITSMPPSSSRDSKLRRRKKRSTKRPPRRRWTRIRQLLPSLLQHPQSKSLLP